MRFKRHWADHTIYLTILTRTTSKQVSLQRRVNLSTIRLTSQKELDALGDELEFEDEEVPSYLQEDELDLPKTAETDPKLVNIACADMDKTKSNCKT